MLTHHVRQILKKNNYGLDTFRPVTVKLNNRLIIGVVVRFHDHDNPEIWFIWKEERTL